MRMRVTGRWWMLAFASAWALGCTVDVENSTSDAAASGGAAGTGGAAGASGTGGSAGASGTGGAVAADDAGDATSESVFFDGPQESTCYGDDTYYDAGAPSALCAALPAATCDGGYTANQECEFYAPRARAGVFEGFYTWCYKLLDPCDIAAIVACERDYGTAVVCPLTDEGVILDAGAAADGATANDSGAEAGAVDDASAEAEAGAVDDGGAEADAGAVTVVTDGGLFGCSDVARLCPSGTDADGGETGISVQTCHDWIDRFNPTWRQQVFECFAATSFNPATCRNDFDLCAYP